MNQSFSSRQITLVGYGNQGKAWAANLRDSGWNVRVSGRPFGGGTAQAQKDGFCVISASELRQEQGIIALLLPDEAILGFFEQYLAGGGNRHFLFAHGFSVTFQKIPFSMSDDCILVAPKGIGQKLRENFVQGSGVMGVLAVEQDFSGYAWQTADAVAQGLGLHRVGIIKSTFSEETKADLLSEQVVLCGAVPRLVKESISFLESKGVNKELATYECLNELKLIVDMMVEHGIEGMVKRVSTAARFGGMKAADQILPKKELRERTQKLWNEIEDGTFAKELQAYIGDKK